MISHSFGLIRYGAVNSAETQTRALANPAAPTHFSFGGEE